MGVYINGMEKPKNCDECWKKYHGFGMVEHDEEWGTFYCKLAKGFCSDPRTKCPLVPVPPHGRLIDGDYLKHTHCAECTLYPDKCLEKTEDGCDWGSIIHLRMCPTIIPAEEAKTDLSERLTP